MFKIVLVSRALLNEDLSHASPLVYIQYISDYRSVAGTTEVTRQNPNTGNRPNTYFTPETGKHVLGRPKDPGLLRVNIHINGGRDKRTEMKVTPPKGNIYNPTGP